MQPHGMKVLGLRLLHQLQQLVGLLVVGLLRLHEVFAHHIHAGWRGRMVLHELLGILGNLGRRRIGNLQAERRHPLVVLRSLYLHLLQVRGITLHAHRLARFGEDGLFREVGINHHERRGRAAGSLIHESTTIQLDGVQSVRSSIDAIDVELTLVEIQELAFDTEMTPVGATRKKEADRQQQADDVQNTI